MAVLAAVTISVPDPLDVVVRHVTGLLILAGLIAVGLAGTSG
ncbi:MAG TPA: hypothetical protein VFO16_18230 [Pseudonocardiaceae bacterium]|nr:hypothetical protein [Pseudonocardiaceae bacterium]